MPENPLSPTQNSDLRQIVYDKIKEAILAIRIEHKAAEQARLRMGVGDAEAVSMPKRQRRPSILALRGR